MQIGGVEDRDDRDRSDVVCDRQRQQEQLEPDVDAAPEQGQHADGERDVRRHGDAPPLERLWIGMPCDQHDVDQCGNCHPTQGGESRQHRLALVLEFADDELALDLEPDDEEEDHHEAVVDQVLE